MRVIAKAIADRESEIERLQAEIKALNEVDKILGTSAPPPTPAARRSSSRRTAAAATPVAETPPDAKPTRKRRTMSGNYSLEGDGGSDSTPRFAQSSVKTQLAQSGFVGWHQRRPISHAGQSSSPGNSGFRR